MTIDTILARPGMSPTFLMSPEAGGGQQRPLPGPWKAATVLNTLDAESLEKLLRHFDREDLERLQALDIDLDPVSAEDFSAIVEDFARRFARRLHSVGDLRRPRALLEEVLGPEKVAELMGGESDSEIWTDERFSSVDILEPLVREEHPQTAAFLLSRVDAEVSATLCAMLEDDRRNDILLRMLHMRPVDRHVIMAVESHIRVTFIQGGASEMMAEARNRLASIVNRMDKEVVERFLDALKQADPREAAQLKKMLFSFEDVAKLSQKDRMVLFDRVPAETTIKALFGAPDTLKEVVLEALGGRMRKMVEAELSGGSEPAEADIQAARQEIAALALELAREGEIVISMDEEDGA